MAWTAPYTAVAGGIVTAADFNTYVRDNLNATEVALAQTPGSIFVGTGLNSIAERVPSVGFVTNSETTSSTTYADMTTYGPEITVNTGTKAIVSVGARIGPSGTGTSSVKMSWQVSGATSIAANDIWAAGISNIGTGGVVYTSRWYLATGLNPGTNTFTAKYAVASSTGTFQYRTLHVIPF